MVDIILLGAIFFLGVTLSEDKLGPSLWEEISGRLFAFLVRLDFEVGVGEWIVKFVKTDNNSGEL